MGTASCCLSTQLVQGHSRDMLANDPALLTVAAAAKDPMPPPNPRKTNLVLLDLPAHAANRGHELALLRPPDHMNHLKGLLHQTRNRPA